MCAYECVIVCVRVCVRVRVSMTMNVSVYCMVLSHHLDLCVAMKRHGDDNEDKQPDKRPRFHQVTTFSGTRFLHLETKRLIYPHSSSTGCAGSTRLGSVALRTGAAADKLPPWASHPEPVGCEPNGTTAVCLPARAGPVVM